MNLLSIIYFWLGAVNGVGAEVPLDEETVKAFIADNPQLFRKLEGAKRFKERVARDVTRFSEELGWVDKQLEKWPRIFLPHPAVVFGVLSAEGSRNRFFTAAEISDEIVRGLSGHVKGRKYAAPRPEVLARSLSALGGIGVVDKLGPADDGEYRYQLARMTDGQREKVQEILDDFMTSPAELNFNMVKKKILDIEPSPEDTDFEKIKLKIRASLPKSEAKPGTDLGDNSGDITLNSTSKKVRKTVSPPLGSVFRVLLSAGSSLPADKVAAGIFRTVSGAPVPELKETSDALSSLVDLCLAEEETFGHAVDVLSFYKAASLTGAQTRDIQKLLDDFESSPEETDIKKLRARIFNVTEPVWANALVVSTVKNKWAKEARQTGEKRVIAVETDWIPDEQNALIRKLVQELDALGEEGPIKVVRAPADTLAVRLKETLEDEGIPLKNVVVIAGRDTLMRGEFDSIRARHDGDTDRAFCVGVNPSQLTGDSYIRLMEMLTMAVRMSFGKKPLSDHPKIEVNPVNDRLYIFIPQADPVDLEIIKILYDAQQTILHNA
ncbi:MAG: hypothetical protein ABIA77_00895 [Candidatus Omnitrophota bacterium]|nr:hypothetical protein [Patescibacteria group bacterium]